eukprot:15431122-Alexandrium_andersonii.AAC.1
MSRQFSALLVGAHLWTVHTRHGCRVKGSERQLASGMSDIITEGTGSESRACVLSCSVSDLPSRHPVRLS